MAVKEPAQHRLWRSLESRIRSSAASKTRARSFCSVWETQAVEEGVEVEGLFCGGRAACVEEAGTGWKEGGDRLEEDAEGRLGQDSH